MPKKWCLQIMVLKKTLHSPLGCKIKPVNPKGNQVWIFIGRTVAEAGTPIFWPPDAKSWLIRKHLDAGKDWGQERRWQQRMRWLDGITESMDMSSSKLWKRVKNMEVWPAAVHDVTKSWTRLGDWTTATHLLMNNFHSTCWLKGNKRLQSCLTKGSDFTACTPWNFRSWEDIIWGGSASKPPRRLLWPTLTRKRHRQRFPAWDLQWDC